MKNENVSTVYAAALLDLAQEKGEADRVHSELLALRGYFLGDAAFRAFIETPKVERSEKLRVLETALRGKVSDVLVNFLGLVVRKGRVLSLSQMLEDYLVLHDKRAGIVHATATTAVPLSEASRSLLADALSAKLKKHIELANKVDPSLLGGLVIRYEGMVADGSLKTALDKVGAGMRAVKLGSQLVREN